MSAAGTVARDVSSKAIIYDDRAERLYSCIWKSSSFRIRRGIRRETNGFRAVNTVRKNKIKKLVSNIVKIGRINGSRGHLSPEGSAFCTNDICFVLTYI